MKYCSRPSPQLRYFSQLDCSASKPLTNSENKEGVPPNHDDYPWHRSICVLMYFPAKAKALRGSFYIYYLLFCKFDTVCQFSTRHHWKRIQIASSTTTLLKIRDVYPSCTDWAWWIHSRFLQIYIQAYGDSLYRNFFHDQINMSESIFSGSISTSWINSVRFLNVHPTFCQQSTVTPLNVNISKCNESPKFVSTSYSSFKKTNNTNWEIHYSNITLPAKYLCTIFC